MAGTHEIKMLADGRKVNFPSQATVVTEQTGAPVRRSLIIPNPKLKLLEQVREFWPKASLSR